ncbi:DUF2797 domain-containing protein [Wenjunlia tyrosinilytica]|uniref:DUF2797 domain-containing protein n=1 Tax=Wenjunlia tyrosinilytica TaxID=1544741 RepID=A0A917ZDM7_9ACTN|nr:DUF2797 domain-containing protein [Wenjunlia tyrosinilytica]GGO80572.1 hypothetical protein GCM10012280_02800 [Wenjunlia tyrosinilytica]
MSDWRCTGLGWNEDEAALTWHSPRHGDRHSPLSRGRRLAFAAIGERTCVGVWRAGRHTACPTGAAITPSTMSDQCADCARLDRSFSIAADTHADDPRTFVVYLAYFGPELLKVGITAEQRGRARLLEQGAITFTRLGRGPLMAARRTEAVLGSVLGVKDRIPSADKRVALASLPSPEERADRLAGLHRRAVELPDWPEAVEPSPFQPVDHAADFGVETFRPAESVVTALAPEAVVRGEVAAVVGHDLYLASPGGRTLLDARLLSGWSLTVVPGQPETTAPSKPFAPPGQGPQTQTGLF